MITCLILVVARLSDATIKHIILQDLSVCKVFIHESLSHVSQASNSSLYTALGTQATNTYTTCTCKHITENIFFSPVISPLLHLLSSSIMIILLLCAHNLI